MSDPDQNEIDEIAVEARKGFDLKKRLTKNRTLRTNEITLYTDEVAGEALGNVYDDEQRNVIGMVISSERVREGVLGRIESLQELLDSDTLGGVTRAAANQRYDQAVAERDALRETLNNTSITIHLRGLPTIAVEAARRFAKKTVGVIGSKVPDEKIEDHNYAYVAYLLEHSVTRLIDHESGEETSSIDYEDAVALRQLLPLSEYLRLDEALQKVTSKQAISDAVTSSTDF